MINNADGIHNLMKRLDPSFMLPPPKVTEDDKAKVIEADAKKVEEVEVEDSWTRRERERRERNATREHDEIYDHTATEEAEQEN
jgi:hypothetical protein